jgi:transposase
MYVDIAKTKKYRRVLLRESYREDGKVKKRTVANISHCPEEIIKTLQLALKNPLAINKLISGQSAPEPSLEHGKSVGAVFTIAELAKRTGLCNALGKSNDSKLALWQIITRLVEQGSRLSSVRMQQTHALAEAIDLKKGFCEDDLYKNLAWIADNQNKIEDRLFRSYQKECGAEKIDFFLYDVTSSYLEGTQNELAKYGYNRDGKKGKLQIVIGLLCDKKGRPISVQVFTGNTSDVTTFSDQIKKVANRFKCQKVTLVGDRGMIKSVQKKDLLDCDFNYITAMTRKQIETLEKNKIIQIGLFDKKLCEVSLNNRRYILRRNPVRAQEIQATRTSKDGSIQKLIKKSNKYLVEHPRAKVETALKKLDEKISKLNCKWLSSTQDNRVIGVETNLEILKDLNRLDGCYIITTNIPKEKITKEDAHACYKSLAKVERAFRESKTGHLELRPIFVRKDSSTRGHVFIVMLAYLLRQELEKAWDSINVTVEEGLACLSSISSVKVSTVSGLRIEKIPQPSELSKELLAALNITLPETIVRSNVVVSTRIKLKK